MSLSLAIIGCGLTGTSMVYQLMLRLERLQTKGKLSPDSLSLSLIEKTPEFGPGFPHSSAQTLPVHLLNQPAVAMSIRDDDPRDFVKWLHAGLEGVKGRLSFPEKHFPGVSFGPSEWGYYPRAVMGEYLKERFNEALCIGRRLGVGMDLYPQHEAVDLRKTPKGYGISLEHAISRSACTIDADAVLLSTGHWGLDRSDSEKSALPGYLGSPWPAANLLSTIPSGEAVAVVGTGPSGIDAVLTLTSSGRFYQGKDGEYEYESSGPAGKIAMYSRGGRLPKVRGTMGAYRNQYLTMANINKLRRDSPSGHLELRDVFQLLTRDLESAGYGNRDWARVVSSEGPPESRLAKDLQSAVLGDGPHGELLWQTVLHQSIPILRDIYLSLAPSERARFDREYRSLFLTYAAPMPSINARKLLALLRAGILDIRRVGDDYSMRFDSQSGGHEFCYNGADGSRHKDRFKYVVDARGQSLDFESSSSILAHRLLRSGLVQIETLPLEDDHHARSDTDKKKGDEHEHSLPAGGKGGDKRPTGRKTGSILIDPNTHQVLPARGPFYAVGVMTGGQIIDASNASSDALSTARVIDHLLNQWIARKGIP